MASSERSKTNLNQVQQHAGHLLDGRLRLAGHADQRALRHVAAERDDEHGKEREVHLVDLRLVGVGREVAACASSTFARTSASATSESKPASNSSST